MWRARFCARKLRNDFALRGLQQPGRQPQQRALAARVGAKQRRERTLAQLKRSIPQHRLIGIRKAHMQKFKHDQPSV
jgi:hypothetical protein